MKLHEYQAKSALAGYGVPVLQGRVIDAADQAASGLPGGAPAPWVLKAQVHTGGRGKAGGVKVVAGGAEAVKAASEILGKRLVTHQTGPEGLLVRRVLIEPAVRPQRELYAAVTLQRKIGRPVLMVSVEGGMDIEAVAEKSPEKILRIDFHPATGLEAHQARRAFFFLGLTGPLLSHGVKFFLSMARAFMELDANLVEVNPLGVMGDADRPLLAMDAKITIDDNAAFRHKTLFAEEDRSDLSEAERRARDLGISYIKLDGTIGCMVNGAGLAMATMDIIQLHGGRPANFLDVGGGANVQQVTEAFKIILSDENVRCVFVNIFGGIMRCDVIAEGIVTAARAIGMNRPLVVRLEGNRVEEGRAILSSSGLKIESSTDLTDGARRAVALAG